jgi:hypothetical protein
MMTNRFAEAKPQRDSFSQGSFFAKKEAYEDNLEH